MISTRADFRDAVRNDLGIPVPHYIDPEKYPAGTAPTTHPNPTNGKLDQKLNEAIDIANTRCGFQVTQDVLMAVPSTQAVGAQEFLLSSAGMGRDSGGLEKGAINTVRRVYLDVGGVHTRLLPVDRNELDRNRLAWDTLVPTTPRQFWIEGYRLYIWPASSVAGTLHLIAGTGPLHFRLDTDFIEAVPTNYQTTFQYLTTYLVALSEPNNAEMMAISQAFQPLAMERLSELQKWVVGVNAQQQSTLAPLHPRRRVR